MALVIFLGLRRAGALVDLACLRHDLRLALGRRLSRLGRRRQVELRRRAVAIVNCNNTQMAQSQFT